MTGLARLIGILLVVSFSFGLLLAEGTGPALAVEPDEVLDDPVLEARARELSKMLRCLVCQNENIDSSHAPLARDLRVILRERLSAGDTDAEAIDFLVARYGDFVLLMPPVQKNTMILWLAPFLFIIFGIAGVMVYMRNAGIVGREADLTNEDTRRLAELMDVDEDAFRSE